MRSNVFVWDWDMLRKLGSHKAFRASYALLFLVPVAAKLFELLPASVDVPCWNPETHSLTASFPMTVHFPIRWGILFTIALFATIGNAIYDMLCPSIVKDFQDFRTFKDSGRSGQQLIAPLFQSVAVPHSPPMLPDRKLFLDALTDLSRRLGYSTQGNGKFADEIWEVRDIAPAAFFMVRDGAKLTRPFARMAASVSYIVAFACIAFLVVDNARFVFSLVAR